MSVPVNLYIFGNGNLAFGDFLSLYRPQLADWATREGASFSVCDFRGVDTLAMETLKTLSANVTLFHIGGRPRYLPDAYRTRVSQWQLVGGFASDQARDEAAIEACTHFLAFDFNSNEERRSGTSRNIDSCLKRGKVRVGAVD